MRSSLVPILVSSLLLFASACGGSSPEAPVPEKAKTSASAKPKASPQAKALAKKAAPAKKATRAPLAAPTKILERPRTKLELPTTSYQTLMTNLGDQLTNSRKAWEKSGQRKSAGLFFANKLLSHGRVVGDLDEIHESLQVAKQLIEKHGEDLELLLLKTEANLSLHNWKEAGDDLKKMRSLDKGGTKIMHLEIEHAWSQGKIDLAKGAIEYRAKREKSLSSIARLAHLKQAFGDYEGADKEFARAETVYKDSSPVPIAWLYVQRGLLRLHTGRFEEARTFYLAAHERAPGYPMATEHLAEIEYLLGHHKRAMELYNKVILSTGNPEFIAASADVLEALGKPEDAKKAIELARQKYQDLFKKYPSAMNGHAADFFMGPGNDPNQAAQLLQNDVGQRRNPDTQHMLAEAMLIRNKPKLAALSVKRSIDSPLTKAEYYWTAAKAAIALQNLDEAAEHVKEAKRLNPRIEELEGKLPVSL